MLMKSL